MCGVERSILWWLYIFKGTHYKQSRKKSAPWSEWDNYRIIGEKMSGKQHSAPPHLLHCCCCCCCCCAQKSHYWVARFSTLHSLWYTAMPSLPPLIHSTALNILCTLPISLSLRWVGGCLLVYHLLLIFTASVYFNSCPALKSVRGQISEDVLCKQWQWCSNTVLWVI